MANEIRLEGSPEDKKIFGDIADVDIKYLKNILGVETPEGIRDIEGVSTGKKASSFEDWMGEYTRQYNYGPGDPFFSAVPWQSEYQRLAPPSYKATEQHSGLESALNKYRQSDPYKLYQAGGGGDYNKAYKAATRQRKQTWNPQTGSYTRS